MYLISNSPNRAVPESSALRDWGFYHVLGYGIEQMETMDYVCWLDETGNLGFDLTKAGTSRYFITTMIVSAKRQPVVKAVKKVFKSLSKTDKKHTHGILHAVYEKHGTRIKLLKLLSQQDTKIVALVLDKSQVYVTEDPHILYASMVNMMLNKLYIDGHLDTKSKIELIISQLETSRYLNDKLLSFVETKNKGKNLEVSTATPSNDKGLQAVDFVAYAFSRKYEYGEDDYYDVIANNILKVYSYYA
jgi:hypothetical protein